MLSTEEEKALIKCLARFPEEIKGGKRSRSSHLIYYVYDLAKAFHSFYNAAGFWGGNSLTNARLTLVRAVKVVLLNILHLLKINARK